MDRYIPPGVFHTSTGVEPYCKKVIILLRALVQDERIENSWSEPQNFGTVLYIINSNINSETSYSPYHLDNNYMNLPETTDTFTFQDEYVSLLKNNLQSLRSMAKQCRDSNEFKRVSSTDPATQNIYQPNDLVLFDVCGPRKISSLQSFRLLTKALTKFSSIVPLIACTDIYCTYYSVSFVLYVLYDRT